jgi:hypothetical protein
VLENKEVLYRLHCHLGSKMWPNLYINIIHKHQDAPDSGSLPECLQKEAQLFILWDELHDELSKKVNGNLQTWKWLLWSRSDWHRWTDWSGVSYRE